MADIASILSTVISNVSKIRTIAKASVGSVAGLTVPSGAFEPSAVVFDGTNDNLNWPSGISGWNDGKIITLSFWYRPATNNQDFIISGNTSGSDNDFWFRNRSISGGIRGRFNCAHTPSGWGLTHISAINQMSSDILNQWNHIIISDDRSINTINGTHFYINGVEVANVQFKKSAPASNESVYDQYSSGNRNIKYNQADNTIGGANPTNAVMDADIAEFYLDDTYHDLSNASEFAKFAAGSPLAPVDLASSWPSGSQPLLYLSGDSTDFLTNQGSGGNPSEYGSLATSTNLPVEVGG